MLRSVRLVNRGGCHLTGLTGAMNGTSPSWSPNGRQLAFAAGGINVINASGTGFRRLTTDTSSYGDDSPAWSVTNRIAFVRTRTGTSAGEIFTMNTDGSGVAPLTHGAPGFGEPSWSPDGKSIAFVASAGASSVIEVARADGTGIHRVSPPSWKSYSPTWIPGGKVAFLAQRGAQRSAYVVKADGTGTSLLYPHLADALQIA